MYFFVCLQTYSSALGRRSRSLAPAAQITWSGSNRSMQYKNSFASFWASAFCRRWSFSHCRNFTQVVRTGFIWSFYMWYSFYSQCLPNLIKSSFDAFFEFFTDFGWWKFLRQYPYMRSGEWRRKGLGEGRFNPRSSQKWIEENMGRTGVPWTVAGETKAADCVGI